MSVTAAIRICEREREREKTLKENAEFIWVMLKKEG
jgi:hypothetical protein